MLDAGTIPLHRAGSGERHIVLLHCLGVDRHLWDGLASDLAGDRYSLWSYDLPGHGETPVPDGPYDVPDLSAQLLALLDREGIRRPNVVGISLGGLIAQHVAATSPDRVARLVLVDTTPKYTDELRAMWAERAAVARARGVAALTEGLLKVWFTDSFAAADPPPVRYVRQAFRRASGEGYALACEALARADLEHDTPRIQAPTLVVCGDQDIPSFLDAARWLEGHIPGARLEWLSPARHASLLEQPDAFTRLLEEFLA